MKQMCKKKYTSPRTCRNKRSNLSCLTVVCKRGSVEFTDTVRQRGLERLLRHVRGDVYFFLHICFI